LPQTTSSEPQTSNFTNANVNYKY